VNAIVVLDGNPNYDPRASTGPRAGSTVRRECGRASEFRGEGLAVSSSQLWPRRWLSQKLSSAALDRLRELADAEKRNRQVAAICRRLLKLVGPTVLLASLRGAIDDHALVREALTHHVNSGHKIGVSANQHEVVALVTVRVINHVNRNVQVSALLFRRLEMSITCELTRPVRAENRLPLEVTLNDANERQCVERLEEYKLVGLRQPSFDARREVLDRDHVVVVPQPDAESLQIEPLIWRVFDRTVVQVESVDVDDCSWAGFGRQGRRAAI